MLNRMTEEELRAQLEAKIRDHLASTFELMRERRAEREVLSEEEWWSLVKGSEFHHSMAERLEEMKEQMLAGRHERIAAERACEAEESMIQMKVSEIFPVLFELRRESGETGSITDDEYHQASVGGSLSQIERGGKKMEGSLDQIQDPRKKAIVQKLSEMAKSDLPHLKRLQDPGVTEEDLTAFSDRSVGNLGELMELITAPMRRTPDPSELAESMETQTLFRPVGQAELDLIESSGWKEFPPRLPIQPIFYPVLELDRKSTRLNSSHTDISRMPSSA